MLTGDHGADNSRDELLIDRFAREPAAIEERPQQRRDHRRVVGDWVQEPTTMPWGNRSILFRDPDGNLVNLFAPVTEEAIKKFSS